MDLKQARRQVKTLEHYIGWCSEQERKEDSFRAPFDEYKKIFKYSLDTYTYLISETERAQHVVKFAQLQYSGVFNELRKMTGLDAKALERNVQKVRKKM